MAILGHKIVLFKDKLFPKNKTEYQLHFFVACSIGTQFIWWVQLTDVGINFGRMS